MQAHLKTFFWTPSLTIVIGWCNGKILIALSRVTQELAQYTNFREKEKEILDRVMDPKRWVNQYINPPIHPNPSKSWIALDLAQSKRGLLQIKLLVAKSIWRNTLCTMHLVFRKGSCSMPSLNFPFHSFKKSLTKPKNKFYDWMHSKQNTYFVNFQVRQPDKACSSPQWYENEWEFLFNLNVSSI